MKWKQWKQLLIVISVIIAVIIFFFREDLFRKNNFPIIEQNLSHEASITLEPLDEQQIAKMAKELARPLIKEKSEKKIVVSQAKNKNTKLNNFKGFLNNDLPDNWSIINSGTPDFIVTGYFFHPKNNAKQTSALFLFLVECETGSIFSSTTNCTHSKITTMCEDFIENLENRQTSNVTAEVINELQDAENLVTASILEKIIKVKPAWMILLANDIYEELEDKLPGKQNPPKAIEANATLIITEDSNKRILELSKLPGDYEILAIKTDYTNSKITTACQNLIGNLKNKPQRLKTIASLNVVIIHKQSDTQFSMKTALTLEEMLKAKPRMRLLGRNYTKANHIQLREAIGGNLSENAKKHLANTAILSIEEAPDGFSLELIRLRGSDTILLASSVSGPPSLPDPRPIQITFKADPQAKVYYMQNQQKIFIGRTKRILRPQDIKELRIREGTKFILERNGNNTQQYIHPDDGEREDDDNMIRYTYDWE